jgi:hypothetical protein
LNAKAPTELDPSLFELKVRGYVKDQKQKKITEGDDTKLSNQMVIRVDSRDMDDLLAVIVPASELQKHNIPSRTDWLESLTDQAGNKFGFGASYKDHQVKVRLSGKIQGSFHNVKVTTFAFDVHNTILTFHILAHDAKGEDIGKIAELLEHNLQFEFKRGEHWKAQDEMDLEGGTTEEQTEMDAETQAKVERAKDKANQMNTRKARKNG